MTKVKTLKKQKSTSSTKSKIIPRLKLIPEINNALDETSQGGNLKDTINPYENILNDTKHKIDKSSDIDVEESVLGVGVLGFTDKFGNPLEFLEEEVKIGKKFDPGNVHLGNRKLEIESDSDCEHHANTIKKKLGGGIANMMKNTPKNKH